VAVFFAPITLRKFPADVVSRRLAQEILVSLDLGDFFWAALASLLFHFFACSVGQFVFPCGLDQLRWELLCGRVDCVWRPLFASSNRCVTNHIHRASETDFFRFAGSVVLTRHSACDIPVHRDTVVHVLNTCDFSDATCLVWKVGTLPRTVATPS
jgi:hypothetical protein